MGSLILCHEKKAKQSYEITRIHKKIYTIEELCYYISNNLYLIDDTVMNERLCLWLQDELNLPGLAARLRANLGKFSSLEDVLYPVFKEINYLTYDELKALNVKLAKLDQEAPLLRKKRKGDALVANKMYVSAIKVYQQLLKKEGLEQIRPGLTMSVWHNLGCAYSYLFQMEKAMECFWEAFLIQSDPKELVCYLLAYRSVKKPQEYENRLKELNVSDEVKDTLKKALDEFAQKKEVSIRPGKADEMLEKLTGEYHRSTGS